MNKLYIKPLQEHNQYGSRQMYVLENMIRTFNRGHVIVEI